MEQNKKENQFNIREFIQDNAFQISTIIVVVLNIWLTTELAPLVKSVELLDQRVNALEEIDALTGREYDVLLNRLDRINNRLNRIENKLD